MKYIDRVYGEFEINESIILDLMESDALKRLKKIDQAGYRPAWVQPDLKISELDHSRFAHSTGVYLLLRQYNASLEEQIAGLIHDVSHSAFSHCIDYVLDDGSEKEHNHQDNVFKDFVQKTKIPGILKRYGIDPDLILDDRHFPLKERELPELCADRIDYSLRTAVLFNELDDETKNYLLTNLTVENNHWVYKTFESAQIYAELFLKLNSDYYAAFSSAIMFRTVGDCIQYALQKKYISYDDIYTTDHFVLERIKGFLDDDERLRLLFKRMNNQVKIENNPEQYDATVFCKSRIVDPLFKHNGLLKRVSEIDSKWHDIITRELKPKEYFLSFTN